MKYIQHRKNYTTWKNWSTQYKPSPAHTSSSTNFTWTSQGLKPTLWDERLATNRLSHGTAKSFQGTS